MLLVYFLVFSFDSWLLQIWNTERSTVSYAMQHLATAGDCETRTGVDFSVVAAGSTVPRGWTRHSLEHEDLAHLSAMLNGAGEFRPMRV